MDTNKEEKPTELKERQAISKNLQVDSEVWFTLIHTYLRSVYENQKKDKNLKILTLENLASSLGRNIVEKCADDKLSKYRSRSEIIKFIGLDVWNFIFGKYVTKIDVREDSKENFIFIDSDLKFLRRVANETESSKDYVNLCLYFVCQLLKSFLESFSIDAEVMSEIPNATDFAFIITIK
jgi:hypothetical protein